LVSAPFWPSPPFFLPGSFPSAGAGAYGAG